MVIPRRLASAYHDDPMNEDVSIRSVIHGLNKTEHKRMRDLDPDDLEKLVALEGLVPALFRQLSTIFRDLALRIHYIFDDIS